MKNPTTEDAFIVNPTPMTTAARGTKRAFNFNAGPGALPLSVLERMRDEMLDYAGTGMSVMELSHRSPEFEAITENAERTLRRVLAIPDDYAVSFLQGGGSLQFAMAPMNLWVSGKPVDVLHTGAWTAKAIEELRKIAQYRLAASTEADKFTRVPKPNEISLDANASYVAMCTNNTIEGTQWSYLPATGSVPLVADMSSDIASKPIDVRRFGLIFAGAQKNLGSAGATVIIIRKDLAERANDKIAKILQYRTQIKEKSLYHTPATYSVYTMGLVLRWIEAEGGVAAIEKRNAAKAQLLYDTIDASGYYQCPVERESRSVMNVVFRVAGGDETVEAKFVQEAEAALIAGVKGHRSVGGMRASIYNAVTQENVEALVSFMREFERKNG
ncbi:MAG TPA: 3-phosphoserine/phosphohydroxythreonine transaminase [Candidatus Acidoferrales bacterium]|nr:3-phosphoserine/phosphohydroxythreonine transaminase [Candidatus Acidoferrales bacterium]